MNAHDDPRTEAEAAQAVALLNRQANDLRETLATLRLELASVEGDIGMSRGNHLLEANEKLVLAALSAETLAERATSSLAEITRSSQRDALTLTANRALMLERMTQAIALAHEKKCQLSVLFLDLDHFRHINNSLGHPGGDEVLKLLARRLELVLPESATVSRHGGDEFLILLTEVTQRSDVVAVVEKMLASIAVPSSVGEVLLHLSASIGIAMYPDDGDDIATLIDCADMAMFRSKRHGPGGFRFHTADAIVDKSPRLPIFGKPLSLTSAFESLAADELHISDLREANEQLVMAVLTAQELELHAQEAHRQQIKFMAMVAHELRNPLTPIRVAASLMLEHDAQNEPSLTRLKVIIDSQVTHMSRLIGDLLDGSRISTGKLRLERTTVELIGILKAAIQTCRPAMELRKQQITALLPDAPILFHGDGVRLAQVFTNLLDNSSKYTPEGGLITLTMTLLEYEMVITVADNGIGISAEALPYIFDLFVQDARALTHSDGGLGIGLAVVRDLVMAHAGKVAGYSAGRNLGGEFVITLPRSHEIEA